MTTEQPQLTFDEAPTEGATEPVRPEGIPEDAWAAIRGLHQRAAYREPFSIGGIKTTREQLQADADAIAVRAMNKGR